jgi:arabinofuranosyltransferase
VAVTGNRPGERAGDLRPDTDATTEAAVPREAPSRSQRRARHRGRRRRGTPGLAALRRSVLAGRNDPLQAALLAVPLGIVVAGGWIHRYVCDDAYITFRVADQILNGHGPVFNAGERVEAVTSPMWLALLTAGEAVVGSSVELGWVAVIGGLVCTALAIGFAMAGAMALVPRYTGTEPGGAIDDSAFAPSREPGESDARLEQDVFWSKAAGPDPERAAGPTHPGAGRAWPVGALVFVCTPPVWWYATSGLETGLTFLWLAVCFWGTARRVGDGDRSRPDRPRWLLVVIGLGILVRPDLGIFALCFAVAVMITSTRHVMAMARAAAWMLALPLAYQVFRMGYYASLVPNTALAKDAGAANWQRGVDYLDDFNGPYKMVIPLAVLAALVAFQYVGVIRRGRATKNATGPTDPTGAAGSRRGRSIAVSSNFTSTIIASSNPARPDPVRPPPPGPALAGAGPVGAGPGGARAALWVIAAPVVGAVVYTAYVTRLGGDYMHARFLMPPLFALVLPVACVRFAWVVAAATTPDRRTAAPLRSRWAVVGLVAVAGAVAVAVAWSASMLATQDYRQSNQDTNLARYKTVGARSDHPVVMDDYTFLALRGRVLAKRQASGEDVLVDESNPRNPSVVLRPGQGVVAHMAGVGLESVAAGTDVWVVDRHGLADPLAARFAVKNGFDLPGHEKLMDYPYSQARFAPPDKADSSAVVAVRHALGCGPLADLYHATGDPLTFDRFAHNIIEAPALTQLRVPDDPVAMEHQFCAR